MEEREEIVDFVSFAIDPGEVSGWGIALAPEVPFEFGIATCRESRRNACETAKNVSSKLRLPLVVIAENWTIGGPRISHKFLIGLGANYGKWLDHIEEILGITEDQILRPVPSTWRNGLFGGQLVHAHRGNDGAGLKRLACAYVSPPGAPPVKDHNMAEAACMACWAHCSEEGIEAAEKAAERQNGQFDGDE